MWGLLAVVLGLTAPDPPELLGEQPYPCTIVLMGDTQCLVDDPQPGTDYDDLVAGVDWILSRREAHRIELVLHPGDVVNGAQYDYQWEGFEKQWRRLRAAGVPILTTIGNHDWLCCPSTLHQKCPDGATSWPEGRCRMYPDAFLLRYGPSESSGGRFHTAVPEEGYLDLKICGQPLRLIRMAIWDLWRGDGYRTPQDEDLSWVRARIEDANAPVILLRHWSKAVYATSLGEISVQHPNVWLAASGHDSAFVRLAEPGRVQQVQNNHQCLGPYQDGVLSLIRVRPAEKTIEVVSLQPRTCQTDAWPTQPPTQVRFNGWGETTRRDEPPGWSELPAGAGPRDCLN